MEFFRAKGDPLTEPRRVIARDQETMAGWPTGFAMVEQLRQALGLPPIQVTDDTSPDSVLTIWGETLLKVKRLASKSA